MPVTPQNQDILVIESYSTDDNSDIGESGVFENPVKESLEGRVYTSYSLLHYIIIIEVHKLQVPKSFKRWRKGMRLVSSLQYSYFLNDECNYSAFKR